MRRSRPHRRLVGLVGGSATLLAGLLAVPAPPAYAEPFGPSEVHSMALVTRLTLDDGQGWLTVQPQIYASDYNGFEVRIPAVGGAWEADPSVYVPGLNVVCTEDAGDDLHYRCGRTHGEYGAWFPVGRHRVTFPVHYSGDTRGLLGSSWLDGSLTGGPADTFPVTSAPHARSTAEIGMAPLAVDPLTSRARTATVPVALDIAHGEAVTALDVNLPLRPWRITGTNAPRLGLQCFLRSDRPSLHCRPLPGSTRFPPGRYVLTVHLHVGDGTTRADVELAPHSIATLTVDGNLLGSYDDFPWSFVARY